MENIDKQIIDLTLKDKFYITSGYGDRVINGVTEFHKGCDYGTDGKEIDVYACFDGEVKIAQTSTSAGIYLSVYYPIIDKTIRYLHLSARDVKKGDTVKAMQKLGNVGTTGASTGIHLHIDIHDGNGYINPGEFYPYKVIEETPEVDLEQFTNDELAYKVINGDFGNGDERKEALGDRYTEVQKIVNEMLNKNDEEFKVGDKVNLKEYVNYDGLSLKNYDPYYYIDSINGDRVVLVARRDNIDYVWAAVKLDNLILEA